MSSLLKPFRLAKRFAREGLTTFTAVRKASWAPLHSTDRVPTGPLVQPGTHAGQKTTDDRNAALINSLVYLFDTYVDIIRISDYAYYMNTMDHAYQVWRGHPQAEIHFRPPDDFGPLPLYPNRTDVAAHQAASQDPIIFAICHFWQNNIDFTYVDAGANVGVTVMPTAGYIHRMDRRNPCLALEPGTAGSLLGYSVELNGLSHLVTVDRLCG